MARADAIDKELAGLEALAREQGVAVARRERAAGLDRADRALGRRRSKAKGIAIVPVSAARGLAQPEDDRIAAMTEAPPEGYRPCVGLALFNARRASSSSAGAPTRRQREHVAPGMNGRCRRAASIAGETPCQAALRELQEETNVTSVALLAEAPGWLSYDLPVDIGKQAWKGRWRGQAQKWFAFRLDAARWRDRHPERPPAATRPSSTPGAGQGSARRPR